MPKSKSVQDVCQEQGFTMLELADKSGIDLLKVQAIFLGRWTATPEQRNKIADTLGVTVDDIAFGHTTPIQHIYGNGPG